MGVYVKFALQLALQPAVRCCRLGAQTQHVWHAQGGAGVLLLRFCNRVRLYVGL